MMHVTVAKLWDILIMTTANYAHASSTGQAPKFPMHSAVQPDSPFMALGSTTLQNIQSLRDYATNYGSFDGADYAVQLCSVVNAALQQLKEIQDSTHVFRDR